MLVYRIAINKYIHDLSGAGAALYGGRWNNKGTYLVYTAGSPSLSLLEVMVHAGKALQKIYGLATIFIPDRSIFEVDIHKLPGNSLTFPPPESIKEIGDSFVEDNQYLALKVPSAVMRYEYNYLINPKHSDFKLVKIVENVPVVIDKRLQQLAKGGEA
jgi:RES domain-containing protein